MEALKAIHPLKAKRLAAGLETAELGKRLGIGAATVRQWERGNAYPEPRHYPKLAKILGMDPEEVVQLFHPPVAASQP